MTKLNSKHTKISFQTFQKYHVIETDEAYGWHIVITGLTHLHVMTCTVNRYLLYMFFGERLNSRPLCIPFCMNVLKHSQNVQKTEKLLLWCAQVTRWCGGWTNSFENFNSELGKCTKANWKKNCTGKPYGNANLSTFFGTLCVCTALNGKPLKGGTEEVVLL